MFNHLQTPCFWVRILAVVTTHSHQNNSYSTTAFIKHRGISAAFRNKCVFWFTPWLSTLYCDETLSFPILFTPCWPSVLSLPAQRDYRKYRMSIFESSWITTVTFSVSCKEIIIWLTQILYRWWYCWHLTCMPRGCTHCRTMTIIIKANVYLTLVT